MNKAKILFRHLKESSLEQKRMAILKGQMYMMLVFAEKKGITKIKDKTVKELKEWSGNIMKRLTSSVETSISAKTESRIERFKYYVYYKDILLQLKDNGVTEYKINNKRELIDDEIKGINKMLNNPDDY